MLSLPFLTFVAGAALIANAFRQMLRGPRLVEADGSSGPSRRQPGSDQLTFSSPAGELGGGVAQGVETEVTVFSGPDGPYDGGGGSGSAQVKPPSEHKVHKYTIATSFALRKARPISIALSAHTRGLRCTVRSIKVEISDHGRRVFATELEGCPCHFDSDQSERLFPFEDLQLNDALPHLREGNLARVVVHYTAPAEFILALSLVSHERHHRMADLLPSRLHHHTHAAG